MVGNHFGAGELFKPGEAAHVVGVVMRDDDIGYIGGAIAVQPRFLQYRQGSAFESGIDYGQLGVKQKKYIGCQEAAAPFAADLNNAVCYSHGKARYGTL